MQPAQPIRITEFPGALRRWMGMGTQILMAKNMVTVAQNASVRIDTAMKNPNT